MADPAQNASIGTTIGSIGGSVFGPLGSMLGGSLGGLLGGAIGGKQYVPPPGTIPQDAVIKMLKQGLSIDQIMAQGLPMSSRYPERAKRQLMKAGVSEADINRLYAGQPGGPGQGGPMGMANFNSLLPAVFGNPSVFSNPNAAGWLGSVFGVNPQSGQPIPAPAAPAAPQAAPMGMPFEGFSPWRSSPGAKPDPFTSLRSLAGPFGNGGGAIAPSFGGNGMRRRSNANK